MVPGNVKRLKIAKMLDTLLLGKILQMDAEKKYVHIVPQKIIQKIPKKYLPQSTQKRISKQFQKNNLRKQKHQKT